MMLYLTVKVAGCLFMQQHRMQSSANELGLLTRVLVTRAARISGFPSFFFLFLFFRSRPSWSQLDK